MALTDYPIWSVISFNSSILFIAAVNNNNYRYTVGIDREDTFLFFPHTNSSVQLTDIYWKRDDLTGIFPNPLHIYSVSSYLNLPSNVTLECFDTESGNVFISVGLFIQGC